jgi:hypothetical protein
MAKHIEDSHGQIIVCDANRQLSQHTLIVEDILKLSMGCVG